MKQKLFLAIHFACFAILSRAQAPQAISYQAVARDNSGNVIANQNISLRFSIHDVSAAGTVVYKETQSTTTNSLGLFSVNVGLGTPVTGTFTTINWAINSKFIQVEMDASGGTSYINMGTQQMLSVPYALYADSSGHASWTPSGTNLYSNNSGKVGIGTTNPQSKLHVAGSIQMTDGSQGMNKVMFSDSTGVGSWKSLTTPVPEIGSNYMNLTSCTNANLSTPANVFVANNYAYVVSTGNNRLCIYDISDPANIIAKGFTSTNLSSPRAVSVSGNYAYVTSNTSNLLSIYDISDPNTIVAKGTITTNLTGPVGLCVSGNYAYVASAGNNRLCIFDISNPNAIVAKGFTSSNLNSPVAVSVSGNFAYVVSSNNNTFSIFNISDPNNIITRGFTTTGLSLPNAVFISGSNAYITSQGSSFLSVYNISNPDNIILSGSIVTGGTPSCVFVSGNYAFVGSFNFSKLSIFDVTNPANILAKGTMYNMNFAVSTWVSGNYAFVVCQGTNSLCSIDLVGNQSIIQQSNGSVSSIPQLWTSIGQNVISMTGGNVGLGCTSPQYKLHVIGDIASTGTIRCTNTSISNSITSCSDIRFKKNITPLTHSLENILRLTGVNYYWKINDFPEKYFNDQKQIGLIAQEVEKIFPELVLTDTDGYKAVDYSKLTPVLIEAIKDLTLKNDALQTQIEKLTEENSSFKKDIKQIQAQLGLEVKAEK